MLCVVWCGGGCGAVGVCVCYYFCIYIWKMVRKKLTLAYLVLVVGVELCLVVC